MRASLDKGLWGNANPVCPYCGDLKELMESGISDQDGEISDVQCNVCEKFYSVKTRKIYEFDTAGDCKKNNQLPHQLSKGRHTYLCLNCKNEYYDFELQGKRDWHPRKEDFVFVEQQK